MSSQDSKEKLLLIDFGSQVTKLIAQKNKRIWVFLAEILTLKS